MTATTTVLPSAPALSPLVQQLANHAIRCGLTPVVTDPEPGLGGAFGLSLEDQAGTEVLLVEVSPDQSRVRLYGLPDTNDGLWCPPPSGYDEVHCGITRWTFQTATPDRGDTQP